MNSDGHKAFQLNHSAVFPPPSNTGAAETMNSSSSNVLRGFRRVDERIKVLEELRPCPPTIGLPTLAQTIASRALCNARCTLPDCERCACVVVWVKHSLPAAVLGSRVQHSRPAAVLGSCGKHRALPRNRKALAVRQVAVVLSLMPWQLMVLHRQNE